MRAHWASLALVLPLSGCATGSSAKWYAPATWFSAAPAAKLDRAISTEETARHAVIRSAQKSAHTTAAALASAPASRPVALATETNTATVALLDQAAGPMQADELSRLRATVAGLLSDNADLRARAEAQRAADARSIGEVSAALAKAEAASEAAASKLRIAFDRENALANELRGQRALLWIAGGVALLLAAGWLYARFALGGIPGAVGRGMAALRARNPAAAMAATEVFDSLLNRDEQRRIAKHAE